MRLYLADTSPRSSPSGYEAALAQYESILADHPYSPHALIEAANVLMNLERPFQAVAYFQKGHALGARHGHFSAGVAYQQLGDYKTAWVYLKKALQVSEGHRQFAVAKHLNAIEAGTPLIAPSPVGKLDISEEASHQTPFLSDTDFAWDMPSSENKVPLLLDTDLSDEEAAYQRAKAQARAEAEATRREEIERIRQVAQQEIDEFIQWAKQLIQEKEPQAQTTSSLVRTISFLEQEMAAHLTGKPARFSPQRVVRANELIRRYGHEEGLSRIVKDDPGITIQPPIIY